MERLDYSTGNIASLYKCPSEATFAFGLAILDNGKIGLEYTDLDGRSNFVTMDSNGSNLNVLTE